MAKYTEHCNRPGCNRVVGTDGARGFCSLHYNEFRSHCLANGSWNKKDEVLEAQCKFEGAVNTPSVVQSKWEYPGREQELIDAQERQRGK